MVDSSNGLNNPIRPARPTTTGGAIAPQPASPAAAIWPRVGSFPPQTPPSDRVTDQSLHSADNSIEPKKLIVGPGISLSGDIKSCDRLVIEGSVQANLQKCQHMTIAESGRFDGNADIDEAEIHGRFEGELVVRKRLVIRAGGHVSGTISYRELEIESGGKISGNVQAA
jgi:cytoskeletal protein CcmA (bactofilin family)